MQKYITILLLLTCSLCYGQGKYTVRKAYQYEGNDSTNAKWVLTEKFNKKGKLVYARYNNYRKIDSRLSDRFEDKPYLPEYANGKSYYTYEDTLLTEELHITKGSRLQANKGVVQHKTFEDSDSLKITYSYAFDVNGNISHRQKTETKKQTIFILECGNYSNLTDKISKKKQQKIIAERNTHIKNRKWTMPDITEEIFEYSHCGKTNIVAKMQRGSFVNMQQDYGNNCLPNSTQVYKCEKGNCYFTAILYKYYGDTTKIFITGTRDVINATTSANASLNIESPQTEIIVRNKYNQPILEILCAARSLRVFLEYLERHPESPIRGKAAETTSGSK